MMATHNPATEPYTAAELEYALSRRQFEVYYQPLIDVRDHSIQGIEALIRWHHPQRGLLNPAEFIPLAEETGLIVPLGAWVLRQACSDFGRLQHLFPNQPLLSVNLSPLQLDEPAFVPNLVDLLRRTGIAPSSLQLEITESVILKHSARVSALFHALRAHGVRIAFDDFGTGYCSLNYLADYPADIVKIDQHFIQCMGTSHVHAEIVGSIIRLAHRLGMRVYAEGVESREQADTLSRLGCNIAQGFLFSPALPVDGIAALLEHRISVPRAPALSRFESPTTPLTLALTQ